MPSFQDVEQLLAGLPGVEVEQVQIEVRSGQSPGRHLDALARLRVGGRPVRVAIEWMGDRRNLRRKLRMLRGREALNAIPAIAAPVIGPSLRAEIQASGVGWIDGRGGIHLEQADPPIFFHVEPPSHGGAFEKRRLFSPVASGVVRVLLEAPEEPVRIADLADRMIAWKLKPRLGEDDRPSRGALSRALQGLVEAELVDRDADGWHVDNPAALLDSWLQDQHARRAQQESNWFLPGSFSKRLEVVLEVGSRSGIGVWLGGLCAAERIKPYMPADRVDAYVFPPMKASMLGNALHAVPSVEGANIRFVLPTNHWVLSGAHQEGGMPVVSKAQIIADLQAEGPRALDVADQLRKEWGW